MQGFECQKSRKTSHLSKKPLKADKRILKWLSCITGPYVPPASLENCSADDSLDPKTVDHVSEVRDRIGFLKEKRSLIPDFASRVYIEGKSNVIKANDCRSFIEIVHEDYSEINQVGNSDVKESNDRAGNEAKYSFLEKVDLKRFYSFGSFETDLHTIDTTYLDHILRVYEKSVELRDKEKRFFRYFNLASAIFESKLMKCLTPKSATRHKKAILKQKFIIFKVHWLRKTLRNRAFNFIYSKFFKTHSNPDECGNFCTFHVKEYLRFMRENLNTHCFDIGYQYVSPDQLKSILKWLKDVKRNFFEFKAPDSFTDITYGFSDKDFVELKPKTLTNKEEMCLELFGNVASIHPSIDAELNVLHKKSVLTGNALESLLIYNTSYSILSPLKTEDKKGAQDEEEDKDVESFSGQTSTTEDDECEEIWPIDNEAKESS
jgi:hypothetical protein